MTNSWYDSGAEDDLILETRFERRRRAALRNNPDPRDPDYPADSDDYPEPDEDDSSCYD